MNIQNVEIELMVSNIFECRNAMFEKAFYKRVNQFAYCVSENIELFSKTWSDITIDTKNCVRSLMGKLLDEFVAISIRTFIGELYDKQKEIEGSTPKERYDYFVSNFIVDDACGISKKYPEMIKLIDRREYLFTEAIREFFERLAKDRLEIEAQFNFRFASIDDIDFDAGDTHNNGRSVIIIRVNNTERIVYKPHSLANDNVFARLQTWLNNSGGLKILLYHPKSIDFDVYGWQEFVKNKECRSSIEVEKYMYRVGVLLAISYLTGCTDLHLENIVAYGEYPIVVDTETLFSNQFPFQGDIYRNSDTWNKIICRSVFSSLLLPINILSKENNKNNEIDISGIFGGNTFSEKNIIEFLKVINEGTDLIRFEKCKVDWNDKRNKNNVYLNEKLMNPRDYISIILEGFEDTYLSVLNNKERFFSFIDTISLDNGVFRQVLRNTELYDKYLTASYHPLYLQNRHTRRLVYKHLKGQRLYHSSQHKAIVMSEIEQLMNGDIPYFYTTFDSKSIYGGVDGARIDNFYEYTIHEQFRKKIADMSENDLYREKYFVRCAFMASCYDFVGKPITIELPVSLEQETDYNKFIRELIEWIYNLRENYHRIRENEEAIDNSYWGYSANGDSGKLEIEAPDLYSGIGSALFYLQACRLLGDKYRNSANELINVYSNPNKELISRNRYLKKSIGLFNGMGSVLYLNYYMYEISGERKYFKHIKAICRRMATNVSLQKHPYDVIGGYSGIIVFCIRAWENDHGLVQLFYLASLCGKKLFDLYQKNEINLEVGLAHGYAGVGLAFLLLSKYKNKREYYNAGINLVKEEDSLLDKQLYNAKKAGKNCYTDSWCYGYAGLLVARVLAYECALNRDKTLFEKDIQVYLSYVVNDVNALSGLPILCHGYIGNLDVLLWYSKKMNDKEIEGVVNKSTVRILETFRKKGIPYTNEAQVANISFMIGLTGLGYYLERYLDPSIPSILTFESVENKHAED